MKAKISGSRETSANGDGIKGGLTKPFGGGIKVIGIASGDGMYRPAVGESPKRHWWPVRAATPVSKVAGRTGVSGITEEPDGDGVYGLSRAPNDTTTASACVAAPIRVSACAVRR
ncbi:MAG: hypothetical protein U0802_07705 [Candidatus Binatia bacterium]